MSVDQEDLKAVAKDKTGVVRIWHDGTLYTLRRPKWGQYKRIRDALKTLTPLAKRGGEMQKALQDKSPEEQAEGMDDMLALMDEMAEATIPLTKLVFSELSDQPFPDNPDDWESWLVTDNDFLSGLLEHWRTVPLARGD